MISEPIFNGKLCDGIPGKSSEFKNSTGKLTALSEPTTVLIVLNDILLADNGCCNLKL